ncbi:hypothetical protein N0V85_008203, partial [Neurospora sp. IMI 360204]
MQHSPTSSWADHDRLEGWDQNEEEEEMDPMELWETERENNKDESGQEQGLVKTEVMELCETEGGEENKNDSGEQEQQTPL